MIIIFSLTPTLRHYRKISQTEGFSRWFSLGIKVWLIHVGASCQGVVRPSRCHFGQELFPRAHHQLPVTQWDLLLLLAGKPSGILRGGPPALGAGGWSSSGSPWFGCALEGILHFGGIFGYRCCGLDTSRILVMPVGTFGGFGDTPGRERQEGTVPAPGSKPL